MKPFRAFILILAACLLATRSQAQVGESDIHSDHGSFFMDSHRTIYQGHVRVNDPKLELTCAWLLADLPFGTNYNRHIVATTNVIMNLTAGTNQAWHVTCDQAVYDFKLQGLVTNELVTLSGHARAESDKYLVTGEPLVYDMGNHSFTGTGYETIFKHTPDFMTSTNHPGSKTNAGSVIPKL